MPKSSQPSASRYQSGAWAVLRTHVAASAMLGGALAFFAGAVPAGSQDGEPMPNVVVTPDCPQPQGFLVDGRPCVLPAPEPASPDLPANPPSTTPTPPPPATTTQQPPVTPTTTTTTPAPPKKDEQPEKVEPKPPKAKPKTRTKLGHTRVEKAKPKREKPADAA